MIKAIIYDADNTLWETNAYVLSMIKDTAHSMNLQVPEDSVIKNVQSKNLPFEDIFNELFLELGPSVLAEYRAKAKSKGYWATPFGLEIVKSQFEKGLILGIMTNRTRMIDERLEQCGYDQSQFSFVYSPPSKEERKPHPNAYENAIRFLKEKGINENEILVVGDHTHDYLSAKARDIKFVGVLTGESSRHDFLSEGLDDNFIIPDLSGLDEIIEGL